MQRTNTCAADMAMHAVNMAEWDTLTMKTEKILVPFTDRAIEVKSYK